MSQVIVNQEGNEFFYKHQANKKMDFRKLLADGQFKFKDEFRIKRVKQLVEIEYGKDFKKSSEIGRVSCIDYDDQGQNGFMYEGELQLRDDGLHELSGHGNYITHLSAINGQFKKHRLFGNATVSKIDGTNIDGNFKNSVLHGQGRLIQADGTKLEGCFKKGKLNGEGVITQTNGEKWQGDFKENKMHGLGKVEHPDGDCWQGFFQEDRLNGQGSITLPNGTVLNGIF